MKTLLFANRHGAELLPLTRERCVALLPIAGKALIVHSIESLAMAKLTEVIVVVRSAHLAQITMELGSGARWGMRLEYLPVAGAESSDAIVGHLNGHMGDDFLVVRGDILRTPIISRFLRQASTAGTPASTATIGGICAGVRYVGRNTARPLGIPDEPTDLRRWHDPVEPLEFPNDRLSLIESLPGFHRANIDAISDRFPGLVICGRSPKPRVLVGRNVRLPASALRGSPIFVGSRCHVAASAELLTDVVVSNDVVIDRGVTLKSAVIMPNTYIGQLLEVSDAIVQGDTLIHVDTGTVTRVSDPLLLRNMLLGQSERGMGVLVGRALGARVPSLASLQRRLRSVTDAIASIFDRASGRLRPSINGLISRDSTRASFFAVGRGLRTSRNFADLLAGANDVRKRDRLEAKGPFVTGEVKVNGQRADFTDDDAGFNSGWPQPFPAPQSLIVTAAREDLRARRSLLPEPGQAQDRSPADVETRDRGR
jgi:NDP-sugar pyrophosphorylase family protein